MMYRLTLALFLLVAAHGCVVGSSHSKKLDVIVIREPATIRHTSSLRGRLQGEQDVSIGEDLFVITRYEFGPEEYVRVDAPTPQPFPRDATAWRGTHVYNDGTSGDLIVFTSRGYYNESVGVILDSEERLATEQPLVQLRGPGLGRRWSLSSGQKFFALREIQGKKIPGKKIPGKTWALRYGGMIEGIYLFDLYDQQDANVSQIVQSIKMPESGFLDGFTVKDVFVKGLERDVKGVIVFTVHDTR